MEEGAAAAEAGEMAADAAEGGVDGGGASSGTPITSLDSSTNWITAHGCLQDSIAFDTSASFLSDDPDGGLSASKSAVLLKPSSAGSGSCEINICFRQSHEIHRVYVRSTARVYEIYYAVEQPCKSNEYLCTVRCGEAMAKAELPEVDARKHDMKHHETQTTRIADNVPKTASNSSSDEEGWVEIKVTDSPVLSDTNEDLTKRVNGKFPSNILTCYEATAEISDVSPCISLTLRLLSLQPKEFVYIEEIYLYADPVELESTESAPSKNFGSNSTGTSLLAMLVPGLLQMSKSSRSKEKVVSDKHDDCVVDENEKTSLQIGRKMSKDTYCTVEYAAKVDDQAPRMSSATDSDSGSYQQPLSSHMDRPVLEGNSAGCSRVEKVLDELLSRVGRIESLCLSFEEKMIKPLHSIETRLQMLEKQLNVLTERPKFTEPQSSRISAPEFTCDESDLETKDCDIPDILRQNGDCLATSASGSKMCPGLVFRAPEFVQDDDTLNSFNDNMGSGERSFLEDNRGSSHTKLECMCDSDSCATSNEGLNMPMESYPEDKASVYKAPEFSFEDDSIGCSNVTTIERTHSKDKAKSSIDTALSSALEAFLSSTSVKFSELNPLSETPKIFNQDKDDPQSDKSTSAIPSKESERPGIFFIGKNCEDDTSVFVSDISSPRKSKEQEVQFSYFNSDTDGTDGTQNEGQLPTSVEDILETADDLMHSNLIVTSDTEENAQLDSNTNQIHKQWLGESSTESIAGGFTLGECQVVWTDLSSTDSGEEIFQLPSWLAGKQDNHTGSDETFEKTTVTGHLADLVSDSAYHNLENVKAESEQVMNSSLDYEHSIFDVKFSLEESRNDSTFLRDLLGETSNLGTQVTDANDDARGVESEPNGSSQNYMNTSGSVVKGQPLVDVGELSATNEASTAEEGFLVLPALGTQQPFSSLI